MNNLLGKIFTFVIFFMSIFFLIVSVMVGASHRNWKEQAKEFKAAAKQAKMVADDAISKTGEKDRLLAAERTARAMQLAQLESQLKIAMDNYLQRNTQLTEELKISQDRLRELEKAQSRLTQQDTEVSELKVANAKLAADIADKFSLVRSLTNKRFELQNELDSLQDLNQDLSADLAQKTKVMNAVGVDNQTLVDHIVPKVDGVITRVGQSRDLVAIGLGSDDGIRVGHEMDVYRRDRYIGKVRISKTDFNVSVARVITDFMQDTVQEGDHVTSKF